MYCRKKIGICPHWGTPLSLPLLAVAWGCVFVPCFTQDFEDFVKLCEAEVGQNDRMVQFFVLALCFVEEKAEVREMLRQCWWGQRMFWSLRSLISCSLVLYIGLCLSKCMLPLQDGFYHLFLLALFCIPFPQVYETENQLSFICLFAVIFIFFFLLHVRTYIVCK